MHGDGEIFQTKTGEMTVFPPPSYHSKQADSKKSTASSAISSLASSSSSAAVAAAAANAATKHSAPASGQSKPGVGSKTLQIPGNKSASTSSASPNDSSMSEAPPPISVSHEM